MQTPVTPSPTDATPDAGAARAAPRSVLARWGLGVALATLALVLVAVISETVRGEAGAFEAWLVLHAAGLVWGWLRMRARPDCPRSYTVIATGLIVQGVLFASAWGFLAWAALSGPQIPSQSVLGAVRTFAFLGALFALFSGPVLGLLALIRTRDALWMFLAQVVGPLVIWMPFPGG